MVPVQTPPLSAPQHYSDRMSDPNLPTVGTLRKESSQEGNSSESESKPRTSRPGATRRPSRAGTRSVTTLTAAQLERKRANDREAQRAIRQRTKDHIESLERRIIELSENNDSGARLVETMQRNDELEQENAILRSKLSHAAAVLGCSEDEGMSSMPYHPCSTPSPLTGWCKLMLHVVKCQWPVAVAHLLPSYHHLMPRCSRESRRDDRPSRPPQEVSPLWNGSLQASRSQNRGRLRPAIVLTLLQTWKLLYPHIQTFHRQWAACGGPTVISPQHTYQSRRAACSPAKQVCSIQQTTDISWTTTGPFTTRRKHRRNLSRNSYLTFRVRTHSTIQTTQRSTWTSRHSPTPHTPNIRRTKHIYRRRPIIRKECRSCRGNQWTIRI